MSARVELRLVATETREYRSIRSRPVTAHLPTYEVVLDGKVVGRVERRMFTREVGPASRPYVSARWESPGWAAGSGWDAYDMLTRRRAMESVLRDAGLTDWTEVEDLAKAAKVVKPASSDG